jgi:hypothetical protein
VLQAHGYKVHLILGGDHTNFYGLRNIYGNVDSYIDGLDPSASYMNSDRWVIAKAAELPPWNGRPVMLQFHLMSAHPLGARESAFMKFLPVTNYSLTINRPTLKRENAINYYDNGVLQMDDVIDKLLGTLRARKYLDNTLVIITGDHGEGLGEHGEYSHAKGVREAMIRIPIIALSFGTERSRPLPPNKNPAQIDIAPTILTELNIPSPPSWRGRPLQNGQHHEISYFQQGDQIGLIDARAPKKVWKYWSTKRSAEEFAYDISSDAGEERNVISALSESDQRLVQEWRKRILQIRPVALGR